MNATENAAALFFRLSNNPDFRLCWLS